MEQANEDRQNVKTAEPSKNQRLLDLDELEAALRKHLELVERWRRDLQDKRN